MNKKIIIVAGDPNSINVELIHKVWKILDQKIKKKILLIANFELIKAQLKKLKSKINLIKLKSFDENEKTNHLRIIDIPLKFKNSYNVSLNNSSKYVIESLNLAHKLALDKKRIQGIINCPIKKELIKKTSKVGVTEFFASKNKINSEIMLLYNKDFSVVPLTTHIDLKKVSKKINSIFICKKIESLNRSYIKLFKKRPKI